MTRAARAREVNNHTPQQKFPPASVVTQPPPVGEVDLDLTAEEQEEILKRTIQGMDLWQILTALPDNLRDCIVYMYRTDPIIAAQDGENKCIGKYSARMFDEATLIENHGGGGYKAMLDARIGGRDTVWKVTRYFSEPGVAKIHQRFQVIDNKGQVVDTEKKATEEKQSSEVVKVLQTVVDALQRNQGDGKAAIADAMQVMKQANLGAVEVLATAAKAAAEGKGGDSAVLSALNNLSQSIAQMGKRDNTREDKLFDALLAQFLAKASEPPPKAPDMLDTLKSLGGLLAGDTFDGLKTILGAGKAKEDSVWEKGLGVLFEAGAEAVKLNAPAIIDWLQRRAWYNYTIEYMAQQRNGAQPPDLRQTHPQQQPAQPVPPGLPRPQATETQAPPPPPAQGQPTEKEMEQGMQKLITEITSIIAQYWDDNYDGAQAAVAVKAAHPTLVPFLRMTFKSLPELIEFAKKDRMLSPAAEDADFPNFANQFFTEFHKADA